MDDDESIVWTFPASRSFVAHGVVLACMGIVAALISLPMLRFTGALMTLSPEFLALLLLPFAVGTYGARLAWIGVTAPPWLELDEDGITRSHAFLSSTAVPWADVKTAEIQPGGKHGPILVVNGRNRSFRVRLFHLDGTEDELVTAFAELAPQRLHLPRAATGPGIDPHLR